MNTVIMPMTLSTDDIQAVRFSTWASAFGQAGYDYRWQQGNRSGTFSITTYQRGGSMTEPVRHYECFSIISHGKHKLPTALLQLLEQFK